MPFSWLITILWRAGIGLSLRFLTCFVIRSYHVISFGGVRTSSLARNGTSIKNKRNKCTGLVNIMKNCIELDAVDKWIDLGLFRLGQSYLSLRGQDDEETSFFCLAPMRIVISMTIEIKDLIKIM